MKFLALPFIIAALAAGNNMPTRPTIVDEAYSTACGPIACFVAARALGCNTSLDETVKACDWAPGKQTSLDQICKCVDAIDGLHVAAVHVTAKELTETLSKGGCVAILPLHAKVNEPNHVVCALSAQDDVIRLLEYPALMSETNVASLNMRWRGEALFVTRETKPIGLLLIAVVPGVVIALAIHSVVRWRARSRTNRFGNALE